MTLHKRILKHPKTQAVVALILSLYIRLVFSTSRKEAHISPSAEPYMNGEMNAIFAFWHGRMMVLPAFCPRGRMMYVLISHHRDGMLIARVIRHFRQHSIHGSSSRGGSTAVKQILRQLKNGDNVSITPDGPRGPCQVVQGGVISTAKLSGKPLVPVCFSASRYWRLRSWDRFMLAKPFGRIVFCVGEPIVVSRNADETAYEQARQMLQNEMNALQDRADRISGTPAQG